MMKAIKKYAKLEYLWLLAPVALWFSYQPLMRFGQDSTMYFELSIATLYLLILALFSIPRIWQHKKELLKNRVVWALTAFLVFSILSLMWTPNPLRGGLTIGVLGCLYLVFLGAMAAKKQLIKLIPKLVKIYIISAVVMSILAVVQLFMGVWLPNEITLLCAGCVAEQFGFARPNLFTIEPQFLGSMLLPAALYLSHLLMRAKQRWVVWAALAVVLVALALTLSRGALFAFGLGFIVLLILSRKDWRAVIKTIGLGLAAVCVSLGLQGVAAALNPTVNESFLGAVSKSVNHLTLDAIDIPVPASQEPVSPAPSQSAATTQPAFDGYVEESTNRRIELSRLAADTWSSSVPNMLFGVGIGGAGVAMNQFAPDSIGQREIVQNQYAETLLEQGIIVMAGFGLLLSALLYGTRRRMWLWSIIAAFMVQWSFFSGLPNALHVYLTLILIAVLATEHRVALLLAKRY